MKLFLLVLSVMLATVAQAATPTLGPDCGVGATVVGSRDAGKVTIGTSPDLNVCTLTVNSWPKVPSCAATLESGIDPSGYPIVPVPYSTKSTTTQLILFYPPNASDDMRPGYVISYLCVGQ